MLLDLIRQGLEKCVEKLKAERCNVDAQRLLQDFGRFQRDFRRRWLRRRRR